MSESGQSGGDRIIRRPSTFVTVATPRPFDGVGRALATAYPAIDQATLPRDMACLLEKIGHRLR